MKRIFSFIFLIGLLACETIVEDLNNDPNNPTDASATLLLTSAQLANITIHEAHVARIGGMWSGYFTGVDRQYADIQVYNVNGSSFSQIWQNIYYGVFQQANLIEAKSIEVNNRLMVGIAKVLKAHAVGAAASGWGDVPLSEVANDEFDNPAFDAQTDVYNGLQTLLDEAILELESEIGSVGVADIYYGGDGGKWLEAAYTLKARLYIETREYELAYMAAEDGISSSNNSMTAPHGSTVGANENTLYTFVARSRAGDMNSSNAHITTLLDPNSSSYRGNAKTDETARYNYYFITEENARFTAGTEPNTYSTSVGDSLRGFASQDQSFPLITYSENLLTLAEAAARSQGFDAGLEHLNTYRAYLNGGGYLDPTYQNSDFSYMYEPYSIDDFAAGGIANIDGLPEEQALLQEILEERYVTFFGQLLGFNDIRRTRNESIGIKIQPNSGETLPERFIYGQEEINSNTSTPNPVPDIFTPTPINTF
ncbi:SusD/RagB family nutrient-binding outer membrane lipoprotein [Zobellia roscoffensis]|uniref:SusD/RagB family nutrient-binding outer membrane lipoprotein n=1 Tax=Zobellia roscoffensis TaxID=2779508 RepID=UPI00188B1ACA|nr:SusD/RagB family nutrient-binding outer membrane lipoprotein [Zobellia roscoffensis]